MSIKILAKIFIGANAGRDFNYNDSIIPNNGVVIIYSVSINPSRTDFVYSFDRFIPSLIFCRRFGRTNFLNFKIECITRVINNEVFLCFPQQGARKCTTWSQHGIGDWLKKTTFEPGNLGPFYRLNRFQKFRLQIFRSV